MSKALFVALKHRVAPIALERDAVTPVNVLPAGLLAASWSRYREVTTIPSVDGEYSLDSVHGGEPRSIARLGEPVPLPIPLLEGTCKFPAR